MHENAAPRSSLYKQNAMCNSERGDFATRLHKVKLCVFYRAVMRVPKVNIFKNGDEYITASKNETKDVDAAFFPT